MKKFQPVMMVEEYWVNSQLSVARYTGGCILSGKIYVIVNKEGITLEELSFPWSRHYVGDDKMAIPPGEPADLIQVDWLPIYRKMGRKEFIKMLQDLPGITLAQAKERLKHKVNVCSQN